MSERPLERLQALRDRSEERALTELGRQLAGLATARLATEGAVAETSRVAGLPSAAAAELGRALKRTAWAVEEASRRAREVDRARAEAVRARGSAEGLRQLLARQRETRRAERRRRDEAEACDRAAVSSLRGRSARSNR